MADETISIVVDWTGNANEFLANLAREINRARSTVGGLSGETKKADAHLGRMERFTARAAVGTQKLANEGKRAAGVFAGSVNPALSTARYALYDVSRTATVAGAALIAPLVAATTAAIKMEAAFAQVARTSGSTGPALDKLRNDIADLFATIPVTYDELTEIATLAGQLGVPAGQIAAFTEITAKLAAVTDLSAESAATALGRLAALIPGVSGNFDRLGSSIALVGVNSVATESQIVNTATQISAMGTFAGLTADQIVGLASAFASIGVQPELARGTITRLFTLMSRAIAQGGDALEGFANVSGVSSAEFKQSWGSPTFANTFLKFMDGIAGSGDQAVAVLNQLGITSVRDVPALLRLANAADAAGNSGQLLAQSFDDALQGWEQNTELGRQYSIIAETVAAKLEKLWNNVQLLAQAIGAPLLEGFGAFLDVLTAVVQGLSDFANSPVGQAIAPLVAGLTAILGVLSLAVGAFALLGASLIAVQQGFAGVIAVSPALQARLAGVSATASGAAGGMTALATAGRVALSVLKALSIVGAAFVALEFAKPFGDLLDRELGGFRQDDITSQIKQLGALGNAFDETFLTIAGQGDSGFASRNVFKDFFNSLTGTGRAFLNIDDALKGALDAGDVEKFNRYWYELRNNVEDSDVVFSDALQYARDLGYVIQRNGDEVKITGQKTAEASGELSQYASDEEIAAAAADAFAASLGLTQEEVVNLTNALGNGGQQFFNFAQMVADAYGEDGGGLGAFKQALIDNQEALSSWQENVSLLVARGATNAATELAALGPAGAQAIADLTQLSDTELQKFEELITAGMGSSIQDGAQAVVNNAPLLQAAYKLGGDKAVKSLSDALAEGPDAAKAEIEKIIATANANPIPIDANSDPARAAVSTLIGYINGQTATVRVQARPTYGNVVSGGVYIPELQRASGGAVRGPGSGTSDSIPAWLSNGEYVIRASAVRSLGISYLDAINRTGNRRGYASGGYVGGGGSFPSTMTVELSPADRMNLWGGGSDRPLIIKIGAREVAAAVRAETAKDQRRGRE